MDKEDIVFGKYEIIHSKVQDEDRKLLIHLPDGYEKCEDRYPVLYLLGAGFEPFFVSSASMIEFVSASGLMPNVIVVGITDTEYFRDMFPQKLEQRPDSTGGSDSFLDFIETDLKPYIDQNYRTVPYSILYGASNAGMLTIYALLARPELFNAYISSSPMLGWFPEYFPEIAGNLFSERKSLDRFLYIIYGKIDYEKVTAEIPKFVKLLKEQAPKDFEWESVLLETEGHVPYTSLYFGLQKLFPNWKVPDKEVTSLGMEGLKQFYSNLSKKYGFDVTIPEEVLTTLGFEYYREEKMNEAIGTMKIATETYPNSDGAFGFLGSLYKKNNSTNLAIEALEKALELNPDNGRATQMLAELKKPE
ncbi:MAG: alpha/beta hydrolase-fold protein [Candidatus Thorarchaeota archaeon]